jgi:hypothetical protein
MDLLFPISCEEEFQKWLVLVPQAEREKLNPVCDKQRAGFANEGNES